MSSEYCFYRHGEINRSAPDLIIGSGTDILLNEEGIRQSEELGAVIEDTLGRPEVIICSPLQRAKQTAEIVSKHWDSPVPVYTDPRLQAQSFGELENKRVCDLVDDPVLGRYLYCNTQPNEHAALKSHGGESLNDVRQRIGDYLNWMKRTFQGNGIVIITHGSILRAINGVVKNIPPETWEEDICVSHGECLAYDTSTNHVFIKATTEP